MKGKSVMTAPASGPSLVLAPYKGPEPLPPAFGKDADARTAEIMGRANVPAAQSVYALVEAQDAQAKSKGEYTAPAEPRDLQAKLRKAQEGYAQLR